MIFVVFNLFEFDTKLLLLTGYAKNLWKAHNRSSDEYAHKEQVYPNRVGLKGRPTNLEHVFCTDDHEMGSLGLEVPLLIHVQQEAKTVNHSGKENCLVVLLIVLLFCNYTTA